MTDLRTAAKQALEALEYIDNNYMSLPKAGNEAINRLEDDFRHNIRQTQDCLRAALEQPNECRWLQDGDEESDTWAASCGRHRYFSLNEGTPKDNRMKHCCYCGKPLVEVPIEEGEV
jgi:hypothetical protein